MAGSLIQIMKHKSVALTHMCSSCENPVIHYSTVHSLVFLAHNDQLNYRIEKHKTRAAQIAEEQIDHMLRQINGCKNKPQALGQLEQEPKQSAWDGIEMRTVIDDKTKATTWITGMTGSCPYCGFKEPWQKTTPSKALKEAKTESFPTVIDSSDRAELWAALRLQRQMETDEEIRLSPDRMAEVREEQVRLMKEQDEAQAELNNTVRQDQIAALNAQKEQLNKDLKAAGMMAFKAKKDINAKIGEVDQQIQSLQAEDKKQKEDLSQRIRQCELATEKLAVTLSSGNKGIEGFFSNEALTLRVFSE
ncbi:MAG: hypothetical protein IJI34_10090 [Clostridia bacterium]|nr:hypothetical protein [Clostridia bacterium]